MFRTCRCEESARFGISDTLSPFDIVILPSRIGPFRLLFPGKHPECFNRRRDRGRLRGKVGQLFGNCIIPKNAPAAHAAITLIGLD